MSNGSMNSIDLKEGSLWILRGWWEYRVMDKEIWIEPIRNIDFDICSSQQLTSWVEPAFCSSLIIDLVLMN